MYLRVHILYKGASVLLQLCNYPRSINMELGARLM